MIVSSSKRTAAPFRAGSGDLGGALFNAENACVGPVEPVHSGKQIVDAPLPHLAFLKRNQGFRGERFEGAGGPQARGDTESRRAARTVQFTARQGKR
ncbi:MAG: hypothetical protein OXO50_09235 [Caldilineaceae bacterium]|nr:hypothetical protein [Caldilineaceae bacterium]